MLNVYVYTLRHLLHYSYYTSENNLMQSPKLHKLHFQEEKFRFPLSSPPQEGKNAPRSWWMYIIPRDFRDFYINQSRNGRAQLSRQICSAGKKQAVVSWVNPFVKMSGFDERPVYFSDAFGSEEQADEREINRISAKKRFREFIREFHEGTFSYPYR